MGVSKPRSGRSKTLTEDDKLESCTLLSNPRVTYEDLLSEVSDKVKKIQSGVY